MSWQPQLCSPSEISEVLRKKTGVIENLWFIYKENSSQKPLCPTQLSPRRSEDSGSKVKLDLCSEKPKAACVSWQAIRKIKKITILLTPRLKITFKQTLNFSWGQISSNAQILFVRPPVIGQDGTTSLELMHLSSFAMVPPPPDELGPARGFFLLKLSFSLHCCLFRHIFFCKESKNNPDCNRYLIKVEQNRVRALQGITIVQREEHESTVRSRLWYDFCANVSSACSVAAAEWSGDAFTLWELDVI